MDGRDEVFFAGDEFISNFLFLAIRQTCFDLAVSLLCVERNRVVIASGRFGAVM